MIRKSGLLIICAVGILAPIAHGQTRIRLTTQVQGVLPLAQGGLGVDASSVTGYTIFGNCTASPAAPDFCALTAAMLPSTFVTSAATLTSGQLVAGSGGRAVASTLFFYLTNGTACLDTYSTACFSASQLFSGTTYTSSYGTVAATMEDSTPEFCQLFGVGLFCAQGTPATFTNPSFNFGASIASLTSAAGNNSWTQNATGGQTLGTDNALAGSLQIANGSANAHTTWTSAATTSNTIAGFATAPATGDLVTCTVSSTTCTLTDGGAVPTGVPSATTFSNKTGVVGSTLAITSLTTREVMFFQIPFSLTVNQYTITIGTITTAGTLKLCVYTADGATKKIDVTSATVSGTVFSTAVSSVALAPGEYYAVIGCATTCSDTVAGIAADTGTTMFGNGSPSGKRKYLGTVSHTSGTCNSTLGTITGASTVTPVFRLDN